MDLPGLLHRNWLCLRPKTDGLALHLGASMSLGVVQVLESRHQRKFPRELRRFLNEVSGELRLEYSVLNSVSQKINAPLSSMSGGMVFGGYEVTTNENVWTTLLNAWAYWADAFTHPDQYCVGSRWRKLRLKHRQLFPIAQSMTGNMVVITDTGAARSRVIFCDHEGGEFDGAILASSLYEFMHIWCRLACPDIDDLRHFYDPRTERLSLASPAAREWRRVLNLR